MGNRNLLKHGLASRWRAGATHWPWALGCLLATACLDSVGLVDTLGPSNVDASANGIDGSALDAASTSLGPNSDARAPTAASDDVGTSAPSAAADAAATVTSTPSDDDAPPPSDREADVSSPVLDASATGTLPSSDSQGDASSAGTSSAPQSDAGNTASPPTLGDSGTGPTVDAALAIDADDSSSAPLDAASGCVDGVDCDGSTCAPGACPLGATCTSSADCLSDNCDNGACAPGYQGAPCVSSSDCYAACIDELCVAGGAQTPCAGSSDCLSEECDDNQCAVGHAGAACSVPDDCHSARCTDAVCAPGFHGAVCRSNGDCHSDDCGASDTCEAGPPNSACQTAADCQTELCNVDTGVCEAKPLDLLSTTPQDGKTGVAGNTNLTLTFSEDVAVGTGSITIYRASNGALFEAIPVSSMRVAISGETVIVNPTATLGALTEYYVLVDAGAFESPSGGQYAGLSEPGAWSFTTLL